MKIPTKSARLRLGVVAAVLAAFLTLGGGAVSAGPDPTWEENASAGESNPSYHKQFNPDGSCDLVDANGVPLYDSQFTERTGSSPCDQG